MKFDPNIVERYFSGRYSRSDFLAINSIFKDKVARDALEKHLNSHWFNMSNESLPEGNIDHVLERIHHQLQVEEEPPRRLRIIQGFRKVAAILIIPLLLGYIALFYFQSRNSVLEPTMAEIQCPEGVRTKFVLPDGTTGFLNSGSSLEYPVPFAREREVRLIGEAYFDVSTDENRSFTVKTRHLSTRVLGTQFNVIAYEDENSEEVILKEGSVEVLSSHGKRIVSLQPDQKLGLDTSSKKFKVSQVQADQYVSWTEGKLVFRNESMQEVANRLGRWFNADIVLEDQELLAYNLWATFIDEQLDEVLKLLAITAPLSYEEQKREKAANNIYMKRKVIIRLDRDRLDAF